MERLQAGSRALSRHQVISTRPWGGFSDREWKPVVDGRTLTSRPWHPEAPVESADVPLLIGTAHDEVRMHLGATDPAAFDIPWSELQPRLQAGMKMDPEAAIDWYRRTWPQASAAELQFKIFTYWRWRHSAIWQAELRQRNARAGTWMYRVDWGTPADGGKWGAFHGIDLPLVFDNVEIARGYYGGDVARAQRMADQMSDAWIAFARSGDPNCKGAPPWPRYEQATRATMLFDQASRVENDPEPEERRYFATSPPRLSK
jgi:para-nitrobenzyl esterase